MYVHLLGEMAASSYQQALFGYDMGCSPYDSRSPMILTARRRASRYSVIYVNINGGCQWWRWWWLTNARQIVKFPKAFIGYSPTGIPAITSIYQWKMLLWDLYCVHEQSAERFNERCGTCVGIYPKCSESCRCGSSRLLAEICLSSS